MWLLFSASLAHNPEGVDDSYHVVMLVGYYKGVDVIAAQYLVNLVEARLRTYGLWVRCHDVCDHEAEHLVAVSLYRTADVAVGYYTYE